MSENKKIAYQYTVVRYENGSADFIDLSEGLNLTGALNDVEELGKLVERDKLLQSVRAAAKAGAMEGQFEVLEAVNAKKTGATPEVAPTVSMPE